MVDGGMGRVSQMTDEQMGTKLLASFIPRATNDDIFIQYIFVTHTHKNACWARCTLFVGLTVIFF